MWVGCEELKHEKVHKKKIKKNLLMEQRRVAIKGGVDIGDVAK